MGLGEDARYEIDFRLAQKESQFISGAASPPPTCASRRSPTMASSRPGSRWSVQLIAAPRGSVPVEVKSRGAERRSTSATGEGRRRARRTRVPTAAALQVRAPTRRASCSTRTCRSACRSGPRRSRPRSRSSTSGVEFPVTVPVQARSEGNLFSGEKRVELHVVPAFAVTATPETLDRADRGPRRPTRAAPRKDVARHRR